MKLFKKIFWFLLLATVLFILFYPDKKSTGINSIQGYWTVDEIIYKEKVIPFTGSVNVYKDLFAVNESSFTDNVSYNFKILNADSISICCRDVKSLLKDSLALSFQNIDLEGNYKIYVKSKIIGSGIKAYYDIRLELISKDKAVYMSRTKPVPWQRGIPKGRP